MGITQQFEQVGLTQQVFGAVARVGIATLIIDETVNIAECLFVVHGCISFPLNLNVTQYECSPHNSVAHLHDTHHLMYVMHTYDICSLRNTKGNGSGGSLQALGGW